MKTTETSLPETEGILLVNAYLDGELDAAASLSIEQRMAVDPQLRAEFERLQALRGKIAASLNKEQASDGLRNRIIAGLPVSAPPQTTAKPRSFDWRQFAASIVIAGGLASGATFYAVRPGADQVVLASIIAGHQRALLAGSAVDVASSDHHTVKPWFDTHLAVSPQIPDLSAAGYVLTGGRIDIVAGQPVPTMVYRFRQHLISLTAMPANGSIDSGAAPTRRSKDGYSVLFWNGRDFSYAAVSDVAEADLDDFQSRWRAAAKTQ